MAEDADRNRGRRRTWRGWSAAARSPMLAKLVLIDQESIKTSAVSRLVVRSACFLVE